MYTRLKHDGECVDAALAAIREEQFDIPDVSLPTAWNRHGTKLPREERAAARAQVNAPISGGTPSAESDCSAGGDA